MQNRWLRAEPTEKNQKRYVLRREREDVRFEHRWSCSATFKGMYKASSLKMRRNLQNEDLYSFLKGSKLHDSGYVLKHFWY